MYDFILNPIAGKGKPLKAMKKIQKYLMDNSIDFCVHKTEDCMHAFTIAANLTQNEFCTDIIVVGGDGTVNEVLNGIKDTNKINLGIIPCGTGNDFADFLNLPKDPVEAIKLILNSKASFIDYLQVDNKRSLNICGMGIDVTVLERCKKMKIFKGKLQYLLSLIITLIKFKWYNYDISIDDGETKSFCGIIAAACNGKTFGGGIPISPKSDCTDGYIDVILINKVKRRRIPLALISLLRGKILKYDFTDYIKCKTVEINTHKPEFVNLDGELHYNLPFKCSVITNSLKVYR